MPPSRPSALLSAEGSRRLFLRSGVFLAAAAVVRPWRAAADCSLTTPDVLGPYWVPNAPWRAVLASADEPGTRLFISGRTLANDCGTGLEGVILDLWQASDAGCYSVVQTCPDEDPFNLRGQLLTGPSGQYAFETVLPGYYPGRCRHIHLRIVPPSGSILVTQLYFEGDPLIPSDPFASQPAAAGRIIPLVEDGAGLHGVFDIDLGVSAAGLSEPADPEDFRPTAMVLHPNFPNPFRSDTTLRFQLPADGHFRLSVHDISGRSMRTLLDGGASAGYHTVHWDGRDSTGAELPAGGYVARLEGMGRVRVGKGMVKV